MNPATNDKALWASMSGGVPGLAQGQFASPWADLASRYAPRTMKDALALCEYLYTNYGIYRKASERIVDYFLTRVRLSGQDDDERKEFEKVLMNDFGIMERLREVGHDFMCYGNSFCSLHLPFLRVLRCPDCRSMVPVQEFLTFQFNIHELKFYAHCQKCKGIRGHTFKDFPVKDPRRIHLVRWNPKQIRIEYNDITGDARYWLEIPPDIATKVRQGDHFTVSTMPRNFIVAIQKNQRFKFTEEYFFHLREGVLAGLNLRGWGIPSVLSAFRNFFRLQVLYRYDEVLKMDYIIPLRILSPAQSQMGANGNDFVNVGLQNFMQQASQAVARHRVDGADWSFFPFAVNYQAVGGEAQQLDATTRDTITAEEDRLLNVRGAPPEFYRSNMSMQVAPVMLRLFERGHMPMINGFERLIRWLVDSIAHHTDNGSYESSLEPVTIADNVEDKMWRLQAAQSMLISKETGFGPMGVDPREEEKRVIDEQMRQQALQQKAQQDQASAQMSLDAGADDGTEAGQSGGGTGGASVEDTEAQAGEIAMRLADPNCPDTARRQELAALRSTNTTLHAVVIKKIEQIRQQSGTAGRAAGFQQIAQQ